MKADRQETGISSVPNTRNQVVGLHIFLCQAVQHIPKLQTGPDPNPNSNRAFTLKLTWSLKFSATVNPCHCYRICNNIRFLLYFPCCYFGYFAASPPPPTSGVSACHASMCCLHISQTWQIDVPGCSSPSDDTE